MQNFRLKDQIDYIRTTDPNNFLLQFLIIQKSAPTIIFNTCHELETDALNVLSSMFPSLHTLLHQVQVSGKISNICLEWLESKEPRSVIYVNFGSITVMSHEQLFEFAWGLANSNKNFLWIIKYLLLLSLYSQTL
ncbi:putative 7-deoxyloganetin glucosyltransferase [Lupinus albus]|uniref:Putative 7-deoxyloganetin glucosyltransferase n=1 Tax=Lupinus albus TaxID=3870 RepID=A0A6A4NS90_LUPAL|nr:putative 7-deoxyloganetin glucosyltransferase [Lupinus albus]